MPEITIHLSEETVRTMRRLSSQASQALEDIGHQAGGAALAARKVKGSTIAMSAVLGHVTPINCLAWAAVRSAQYHEELSMGHPPASLIDRRISAWTDEEVKLALVDLEGGSGPPIHRLCFMAPDGNYKYELASIRGDIESYPVTFYIDEDIVSEITIDQSPVNVPGLWACDVLLGEILESNKAAQVMAAIKSQIKKE